MWFWFLFISGPVSPVGSHVPNQGANLHPVLWSAGSLTTGCQGGPSSVFLKNKSRCPLSHPLSSLLHRLASHEGSAAAVVKLLSHI